VNNTSQKAEEKSVIRKYLPVESNRCVGGVAAGENCNEYCEQCSSFIVTGLMNIFLMTGGNVISVMLLWKGEVETSVQIMLLI
jgi:hypothetical protein